MLQESLRQIGHLEAKKLILRSDLLEEESEKEELTDELTSDTSTEALQTVINAIDSNKRKTSAQSLKEWREKKFQDMTKRFYRRSQNKIGGPPSNTNGPLFSKSL